MALMFLLSHQIFRGGLGYWFGRCFKRQPQYRRYLWPLAPLLPCILWAGHLNAAALSLSPMLYSFNYKEFNSTGQLLDEEDGKLMGYALELSGQHNADWHSALSLLLTEGEVNYDGETQSGAPHETRTDEDFTVVKYQLQHRQQFNQKFIALGLGVAYLQWDRDIQPRLSVRGLYEEYRWWEADVAVKFGFEQVMDGRLSFEVSVLQIINPTLTVDLSEFSLGKPDLSLGERGGYQLSLEWVRPLNQHWQIGLRAWLKEWRFGRSNAVSTSNGTSRFSIVEPASTSRHAAMEMVFTYLF